MLPAPHAGRTATSRPWYSSGGRCGRQLAITDMADEHPSAVGGDRRLAGISDSVRYNCRGRHLCRHPDQARHRWWRPVRRSSQTPRHRDEPRNVTEPAGSTTWSKGWIRSATDDHTPAPSVQPDVPMMWGPNRACAHRPKSLMRPSTGRNGDMSSQTSPTTFRTGINVGADSIMLLGRPGDRTAGQDLVRRTRLLAAHEPPPDDGQRAMFEVLLMALADHGFTPTAIATRVTLLSAGVGPGAPPACWAAVTVPRGDGGRSGVPDSVMSSLDALPSTTPVGAGTRSRPPPNGQVTIVQVSGTVQLGDPTPVLLALAREHGSTGHLALFAIGRVHAGVPEEVCRSTVRASAEQCSPTSDTARIIRGVALLGSAQPARPHRRRTARPDRDGHLHNSRPQHRLSPACCADWSRAWHPVRSALNSSHAGCLAPTPRKSVPGTVLAPGSAAATSVPGTLVTQGQVSARSPL